MLTSEQNERLTRVGPGTPTGELMRRYWQPFLPAAKLEENPVQKVRLLGEDLVCFRDRSGDIGLVGDRCAHRLVNLEFGIPDEHGLRCPYHGWCYDSTGQCIDTPLESHNSRLKEHIVIPSYPVREMGGLLFAYMGPKPVPVLPPWDLFVWPNSLRQIGYSTIPCNWLQCHENAADPVHSIYLHGHFFKYVLERKGLLSERASDQTLHRAFASIRNADGFDRVISKVDEYGVQKAMVYRKEKEAVADTEKWHSWTIFPNFTRPGVVGGIRNEFQIRVPIDDTHTMHFVYDLYAAPESVVLPPQASVPCYEIPMFDDKGAPIFDYVLAQDMMAWWSQGSIVDRSKEHLCASDEAIRRYRDLLEEQIQIVEAGKDPMNVFRDEDALGSIIHLHPHVGERVSWVESDMVAYRERLVDGYIQDDADRYSPLREDLIDMYSRIEEAAKVGRPS